MEIRILVGREEIGRCLEWCDRVEPINPSLLEWVSYNWFVDLTIPVLGPSTGWKGMSSKGYGDRLDACFFSFWCGVKQCLSSYEAPFRDAVMCQGPVNA